MWIDIVMIGVSTATVKHLSVTVRRSGHRLIARFEVDRRVLRGGETGWANNIPGVNSAQPLERAVRPDPGRSPKLCDPILFDIVPDDLITHAWLLGQMHISLRIHRVAYGFEIGRRRFIINAWRHQPALVIFADIFAG